MAYIEQHYNLEWTKNTGPLGDTFGGLLSPIIGLVSVYFIYETFKAQREQLIEQKLASEASLSLQREQLKDQKRINGTAHIVYGELILPIFKAFLD